MSRLNYVCATCSEHFTRRYNGIRHNIKIHSGRSEIVRLIDYLADRQSGKYKPINPSWYSNKWPLHDSYKIFNTPVFLPLQPRYREKESHYSERAIKIKELETLVYKHRSYFKQDPLTIIRNIIAYSSSRRDDSVIDEKLEQLRVIDRRH